MPLILIKGQTKGCTEHWEVAGLGWLDDPDQAQRLNDLHVKEWNLYCNFFLPAMKHLRTEVEGSRKKRIDDQPATPFELKRRIENKPRRVLRLPSNHARKAAA